MFPKESDAFLTNYCFSATFHLKLLLNGYRFDPNSNQVFVYIGNYFCTENQQILNRLNFQMLLMELVKLIFVKMVFCISVFLILLLDVAWNLGAMIHSANLISMTVNNNNNLQRQ